MSIFIMLVLLVPCSKLCVFHTSFSFCDLAGAERSKKTLNVGDRLKESNNINTSLHVLGRCMSIIRFVFNSV